MHFYDYFGLVWSLAMPIAVWGGEVRRSGKWIGKGD